MAYILHFHMGSLRAQDQQGDNLLHLIYDYRVQSSRTTSPCTMANATYLYNRVSQVYLYADFSTGSQLRLRTSSLIESSLFLTFTPVSTGESTICTFAKAQPYCLDVWLLGASVHLGQPNNNGSQLWTVVPAGDGFKLSNSSTGKGMFLDVNSSNKAIEFSKGNSMSQVWTTVGVSHFGYSSKLEDEAIQFPRSLYAYHDD